MTQKKCLAEHACDLYFFCGLWLDTDVGLIKYGFRAVLFLYKYTSTLGEFELSAIRLTDAIPNVETRAQSVETLYMLTLNLILT